MRSYFYIAFLAAGLLASSSTAINLFQRNASPAVVTLGTYRKSVQDPVQRDTLRRRQTVTETLDNGVSSHSRIHAVKENVAVFGVGIAGLVPESSWRLRHGTG